MRRHDAPGVREEIEKQCRVVGVRPSVYVCKLYISHCLEQEHVLVQTVFVIVMDQGSYALGTKC